MALLSNGALAPNEQYWVRLQPFLLARGYRLRPRYDPQWQPSWMSKTGRRQYFLCEDSIVDLVSTTLLFTFRFITQAQKMNAIDATRIEDGFKVVLKRIRRRSNERDIMDYLSSPAMRSDARNRTVPMLDVVELPDNEYLLLVMPHLRGFDTPPFHCYCEVVDAFRQFLQGLTFMHEHNVAHRYVFPDI